MTSMADSTSRATPLPGPSNAELLAALGGDHESRGRAWRELVARYSTRLYAVARSFGVDEGTAEDLVQTAWLRLLERAQQVRDADALGAWLATVVRNEALRLVSRRREFPSVAAHDDRPDTEPAPDHDLLRTEAIRLLRAAFAYLGEECQQLLRLCTADPPLSYDEIAAAVGRPRGSLGPTRRRCLESLRARLPAGFEW